MDTFGAYLKAHREKKGIRLEEIASITKIHLHALELLEASKFDALPPEPFIRGFIIAYAKYVGIPTSEVLDKYRQSTGVEEVVVAEAPPVSGRKADPFAASPTASKPVGKNPMLANPNEILSQMRLPSAPKLITAASLIGVIGLATLLINVGKESEAPPVQAVPTQVTMTPETPLSGLAINPATSQDNAETRKVATDAAKPQATTTPPAPETTPAVPAGPTQHEVMVESKERTWIKVVIDDTPPTEYFLGEGKSATYKAANKIKVVLGNSTGSRVVHNGQEVDGTKFLGTIKSYKFPSNARFPQDIPAKLETSTTPAPSE